MEKVDSCKRLRRSLVFLDGIDSIAVGSFPRNEPDQGVLVPSGVFPPRRDIAMNLVQRIRGGRGGITIRIRRKIRMKIKIRKRIKSTRQRGGLRPNLPRNPNPNLNLLDNLTPHPALARRWTEGGGGPSTFWHARNVSGPFRRGICYPPSALRHLSSAIRHLSSAIRHLSPAIRHLSSAIRHLSSAISPSLFPVPNSAFRIF